MVAMRRAPPRLADEPPATASTAVDPADPSSGNSPDGSGVASGFSRVSCSTSGGDAANVGDGNVQTQQRPVVSFEKIEVSGCADVVVRLGAPSVAVTTDANLQAQVTTAVEGSKLRIGIIGSFSSASSPKVVVTTNRLDRLQIFGAADAVVESIGGDEFTLEVGGAGDVSVTGAVAKVDVEVSGSASTDLSALDAAEVSVSVSGTGSVEVRGSTKVRASVSGTGEVVVHGAAEIDAYVDGVGEVRRSDGTVVAAGPLGGRRSSPSSQVPSTGGTPEKGAIPQLPVIPRPVDPGDLDDFFDDTDRRIDEVGDAIDAYTDCVDEQLDAGNHDRLVEACDHLLPR